MELPKYDSHALIGQSLAGYELLEVLGEGGMGAVYLARHGESGEEVAIKLLLNRFTSDEKMTQRFLNEALAADQVDHPGVLRIHDSGRDEKHGVYLVMELLRGSSLLELCAQHGAMWPLAAARKMHQVALPRGGHRSPRSEAVQPLRDRGRGADRGPGLRAGQAVSG